MLLSMKQGIHFYCQVTMWDFKIPEQREPGVYSTTQSYEGDLNAVTPLHVNTRMIICVDKLAHNRRSGIP